MALIYRAIFEVDDDGSFLDRVDDHVEEWLRWKLRDRGLILNRTGETNLLEHGLEVVTNFGADDSCAAKRVNVFEGRRDDGVQVKTTITAIRDGAVTWAWVDLERWSPDHSGAPWIPAPPGVVTSLLLRETAMRGGLKVSRHPVRLKDDGGALLADIVLDGDRELPVVVVSYSGREVDGGMRAYERGREVARKLAGVASTYVLGEGAVSAFSRAMFERVGDGMDVHSGAIRTYLPGAGSEWDRPWRHRLLPFAKLQGRRDDVAARLIAPPLFRRSAESPPPAVWRRSARSLLVVDRSADELEALLALADAEIDELKSTTTDLRTTIADLRDEIDAERDVNDALLRLNDDLGRRLSFLRRSHPHEADSSPEEPSFEPVLCSEVIQAVRSSLDRVVVPLSVDEAADALDEHGNESWAPRAWAAFRALNNYAELKDRGEFDGSFLTYCTASKGEFHIPAGWVAPTESQQTLANPTFRALRTLPVDLAVDPAGFVLMAEHIRIERGGTPSPRIHYFDDTRGATRKIHVGWFGDHLDSRAKS